MNRKILIADDEKVLRDSLKMVLEDEGYITATAEHGEDALNKLSEDNYDLIISDIKMPKMDGMELLGKVSEEYPETSFFIMTAFASVESAIEALRKGAYDYIIKPVEFDDLLIRIKRLMDYRRIIDENTALRRRISRETDFSNIIGKSEPMKKVFNLIQKVAPTNSNVLITGKSGTGKELAAKAIHKNSSRGEGIFLPINCGAISENLIESELFGHKKGAFTGAGEDKLGLFKVADGGTLFLDEIGDLPLNMQVKLLRAIEDREFYPVGSTKPVKTDVRIIAATNKDLFEKTKEGEFREDLFYRLNVVEIKLPSLNERKDDIPVLVNHFIEKYSIEMNKKVIGIDNDTMKTLLSHDWRGGVRELENIIERAVIFASGDSIKQEDLADNIKGGKEFHGYPDSLKDALKNFEKEHLLKVIKKYDYVKEDAAKALNIGLSSLYRKMEELGIPTKISAETDI